jgi:hypothetical protein
MDASVLAAIARWPNVPDVYGWLSLTARGQWRLRGEAIGNAAIRDFIGRNYSHDERGCWCFQNGPQRVYVALELTPWVYRWHDGGGPVSHTGVRPRELRAAALLDDGRLVLATELGAGVIDDRDAPAMLPALAADGGARLDDALLERWLAGGVEATLTASVLGLSGAAVAVERLDAGRLGSRFGFVRDPSP